MEFERAVERLNSISDGLIDYYYDLNVNSICRICLEKLQPNKKMCNIFEMAKPVHICSMIMSCASVEVIEGDGLPNMICQKCMAKLNIAWQFKMQCESSDIKLRQLYANTNLQINGDLGEYSLNSMKSDDDELCILKQQQTSASNNVDFDLNDVAMSIENDIIIEANLKQQSDDNKANKKPARQKSDKAKEQKVHQCDTCGKTFNRREYLTQHIRIHTGEKPYRCHLCEKRFVNSGHLTTHMRTHTGERPHRCNMCPKAFSTKQELHKHTMVHNGERPFVCKMCGKRFGSSSNLYSHLKHHTGEKNFTCEHCGKAFYTKQELKQHLVVHTGEKAFLCEYCNKRFSQIAHLKRHSKLHKSEQE